MTLLRCGICTLVFLSGAPRIANAQDATQRHAVELGMDAAIVRETNDLIESTFLSVPVSRFRVGFFASNALSIEPAVSFGTGRQTLKNTLTQGDVTTSGTSYDLDVGLLYHFRSDRAKSQPYIRPFVGIRGFKNSSDDDRIDGSGSQTSYGGGIGLKLPLGSRLGARTELGYAHRAENTPQFQASNSVFVSFGLSFFTR